MNGCVPDPKFDPAKVTTTLNKWIVGAVADLERDVAAGIENYKFNDASMAIYQFVWGTFCDWYLEFSKPILQNGETTPAVAETRATTAWVLDQVLLLLNPFMPFITEELFVSMAERPLDKMLVSSEWPAYPASFKDVESSNEIGWLIRMISEIRSVRADMNVPAAAKINLQVKDASAATQRRLKTYDEILCRMARLENVTLTDTVAKGAIQSVVDESTIILPIADIIDLDKERARLRKEIEKLNAELAKIRVKMADQKFVANAPAEIIEEQHSRQASFEATLNKFSAALKQLEAA
jgi:valyl-tRNA synthetase